MAFDALLLLEGREALAVIPRYQTHKKRAAAEVGEQKKEKTRKGILAAIRALPLPPRLPRLRALFCTSSRVLRESAIHFGAVKGIVSFLIRPCYSPLSPKCNIEREIYAVKSLSKKSHDGPGSMVLRMWHVLRTGQASRKTARM